MTDRSIRAALISTDTRFREQFRELVHGGAHGIAVGLEIVEPFVAFGEDQVRALRQLNPELVVIDLENDAEIGVKFTQFLGEMNPAQRVIAVGPQLSPELLLRAMRAGVADFVQKPVDPDALRAALVRVSQLLGHAQQAKVPRTGAVLLLLQPQGRLGRHQRRHQRRGGAAPPHRQADAAGGPRHGAGRGGPAPGDPAAVQLRGHGEELPPDGRRAARQLHRAALVGHPPALGAVPPRAGRGGVGRGDPEDPPVPAAALRLRGDRHAGLVLAGHARRVRPVGPGVPGEQPGPALAAQHPAGAAACSSGCCPGASSRSSSS